MLDAARIFIPVISTLALIFWTRRTSLSLLVGALVGGIILYWKSIVDLPAYSYTITKDALLNPWHYSALFFTISLGGFARLIEANGGLRALFQKTRTVRHLQFQLIGMGFLCFFDGLANSFLIGRVVRPIADRVGMSREKLAYLADTTGSAVACIAPISTWIAMQLGLISVALSSRGISASPYELFLKSVPLNFYCLLSLGFAFYLAVSGKEFFTMKQTKAIVASEGDEVKQVHASLWSALIPILVLLVTIPFFYYIIEMDEKLPITFTKLSDALGGGSGPQVFILSSCVAHIVALISSTRLEPIVRFQELWFGMREMFGPLFVLICAWLFGTVMKDLGAGNYLADHVITHLPLAFYPTVIFLVGCLLSFTTGTSWGTMALLFPLVFESLTSFSDGEVIQAMPLLIAAIFSGSVFGDHCSPFSDTTIVSSVASGISAESHVKTQLPYALIVALAAILLGFLPIGFVVLNF